MENGCKWYFGPEGGTDNGPTNPSKGTFRFNEDISIVREAIQNSLDVPADADTPVEIKFSFSKMRSSEFPNFFGIREHINASFEYYKDTDRAKEKFPDMIAYLSKDGDRGNAEYADSVDIMTIGDYHTKGMLYEANNRMCPFHAFFHSIGVSVNKGSNSGGSNGLGKETLFNRSKIKTLLLCSRSETGTVVFQGASKLTTHLALDGSNQRVTAFGYYGINNDEPVTVETDIPECFRRNEIGTDVHVVGIDLSDKDKVRSSIVEAVLNHFWLAVHRKKLVVDVDGVRIDSDTLCGLIDKYFSGAGNAEGQINNYEKWNPRPFYNAVLNADAKKEKTAGEVETLPTVGRVKFYLDWSSDDLPKRISYMRVPRMVIFKRAKKNLPSFVGVFVCDNDEGNKMLRRVEPPAHDEWAVKYYEGSDTDIHRKAISEVDDFVNRMLDRYLKPKASHNEIIIPGIAELLPDTDEETAGGEHGTAGSGSSEGLQPSGKLAEKETAAPTTFIDSEWRSSPARPVAERKGSVTTVINDTAPSDDGEPAEITGTAETEHTDGESSGGGGGGGSDSQSADKATTNPKQNAKTYVRINVTYRAITFTRDGELWHRMIVRPDPAYKGKDFSDVMLHIKTGSDNGSAEETEIKKISGLLATTKVDGNCISGLDLKGEIKFDVRFADSFMHSVKVVAHASK